MVRAKKIILLIVLIAGCTCLHAQNDSVFSRDRLSSFKLINISTGKQASLAGGTKRFTLFIFLSPECPLSQNYLPLLNELNKNYSEAVSFEGIIPGNAYSRKTIKAFVSKYSIQFPVLIDRNKLLVNYLQATVTPEVILLNDQNELIYRGAIDDLVSTLGKRRLKATNGYLENAISISLAGKTVALKRTKATGCKINDY